MKTTKHTGGRDMFLRFMEDIILLQRRHGRVGTANNYRAAASSFRRFLGGGDVRVGSVDAALTENYQMHLRASGLSPNSVSFHMKILRAVYNRAVVREITDDRRPFRSVFTGTERTRKRAIAEAEMRRIRNLNLSGRPSLEFARDLFMFLFFCRGMSFVDAAYLRKTDLRDGFILYRRQKTGQQLCVRAVREITEIVNRYAIKESPYLLPIITCGGAQGRREYEAALRRTNRALKEVAREAHLRASLTTYVSRHAWATMAKRKNIPIAVISDALGHDSERTTRVYLASFDTATIDSANALIMKSL